MNELSDGMIPFDATGARGAAPAAGVFRTSGGLPALWALAATLAVALFLLSAGVALADIVYLYDDLGRLVRVVQADGQAATYHYDAVGNILQITRETGVAQTTSVTAISQPSGDQGSTVPL